MKSTSRYALVLDDDSSSDGDNDDVRMDDVPPPVASKKTASVTFAETPPPQDNDNNNEPSSILRRRQDTPFITKTDRVQFEDEAGFMQKIIAESECLAEVRKIATQPSPAAMVVDDESPKAQNDYDDDEEVVDDNDEIFFGEMYEFPDPSDLFEAEQGPMLLAAKSQLRTATTSRSSIDFGLRYGNVSRAGWHPSGRFLHPINLMRPIVYRPSFGMIAGGTTAAAAATPISLVLESLQLVLSKCSIAGIQDLDCPMLQIPLALQKGGNEQSHAGLLECLQSIGSVSAGNDEAKESFRLLAALLESVESSPSDVLMNLDDNIIMTTTTRGGSYTFNERRNQALLRWLIEVNAPEVEKEVQSALSKNDAAGAIFAAVSGGDLALASQVAENAGELDLALVLASGAEGRGELAKLLHRLAERGQLSSMSRERLRAVRAVSESTTLEESLYRNGTSSLSWQKRWALKLLQDPAEDLMTLISTYDEEVKMGVAPFPCPKYAGAPSGIESVQYRILRVVADPKSLELSEVVNTNGFTDNPHDFSVSFLLAVSLVASGYVALNDLKLEKISSGFEAQLIAQGAWEWAVAISLFSCDSLNMTTSVPKARRAHEYVLQFCRKDVESQRQVDFLEQGLGIPSVWISEAKAYRSSSVREFVSNYVRVDAEEALSILERQFLPDLFFSNKDETFELLSEIGDLLEQAPASLGSTIHRLYLLDAKVKKVGSGDAASTGESLSDLEAQCLSIRDNLTSALVEEKRHSDLSPVPNECRADTKSLIQEALGQVRKIRFQLASTVKQQQSM